MPFLSITAPTLAQLALAAAVFILVGVVIVVGAATWRAMDWLAGVRGEGE